MGVFLGTKKVVKVAAGLWFRLQDWVWGLGFKCGGSQGEGLSQSCHPLASAFHLNTDLLLTLMTARKRKTTQMHAFRERSGALKEIRHVFTISPQPEDLAGSRVYFDLGLGISVRKQKVNSKSYVAVPLVT